AKNNTKMIDNPTKIFLILIYLLILDIIFLSFINFFREIITDTLENKYNDNDSTRADEDDIKILTFEIEVIRRDSKSTRPNHSVHSCVNDECDCCYGDTRYERGHRCRK